jgi:hypothetical protein
MTTIPELPNTRVVVPDLGGLEYHDAKYKALRTELFLVFADPDHAPLVMCFVVKQEPRAGALVGRRSAVTVWVEDATGGVSTPEPRRPSPSHGDEPMALVEER